MGLVQTQLWKYCCLRPKCTAVVIYSKSLQLVVFTRHSLVIKSQPECSQCVCVKIQTHPKKMTFSTLVFQKQQNKPINIPYFLWSLFLILDWSRAAPEDESFKNSVDLQKTAVLVLCFQPPAEKASTCKLKLILCCTSHTFGRRSWGRNQHLVRLSLDVALERCQGPLWHHKGPCLSAKFQRKRSKNWIYSILKKKQNKTRRDE